MEQWFIDFALDPEKEIGELPELTQERLERQFGVGDVATQLRTAADVLLKLEDSDYQTTLAMYVCGYPPADISKLGFVRLSTALKEFDALLPLPAKQRRQRKLASRTLVSIVSDDMPDDFDDPIEKTHEDDDIEEMIPGVHLSEDMTGDYLRKLGRRPLLKAEDEVEYAIAMEVGALAEERLETIGETLSSVEKRELLYLKQQGERAFSIMVESNMRLVASIARRYTTSSMSYVDLMQEGNIGLIRAVHKFDYTKGFKFSTYGSWWIKQSVRRAIADQDRMIRLPVHTLESIEKIRKTRSTLEVELGRLPTNEELAHETALPLEKIEQAAIIRRDHISLNLKIGEDAETEFGDLKADDRFEQPDQAVFVTVQQEERRALVDAMLARLSPRHAAIVCMRWGIDDPSGEMATLDEVGEQFGITRERVRQIELKAMAEMKSSPSLNKRVVDLL